MSGKGGKKFASRGRRREKMWDKMGISWAQEKKRATLPTKFANGHNGKGKFEWADHFQVVGDWFAFITRLLFFLCFLFFASHNRRSQFLFSSSLCFRRFTFRDIATHIRHAHSHVRCFTNARSRTQQSNESDKRRDNRLPCPWRNKEDQNSRFCHPETNLFH